MDDHRPARHGTAIVTAVNELAAFLTGQRPTFGDAHLAGVHLASVIGDRRCLLVVDDVWSADLQQAWGAALGFDAAALWSTWASDLRHATVSCGHFMAEEAPADTSRALRDLLARWPAAPRWDQVDRRRRAGAGSG